MKTQIEKIIEQLQKMLPRACALRDSENEHTAERYDLIVDCLNEAIEALHEAIATFEQMD